MVRTAFFFSALLSSLSAGVALAAPDGPQLEYREPSGVDVEAEWDALPEELADVVEASSVSFRGEILTTREAVGGPGPMTIVAVVVDEVYKGSFGAGAVVEVESESPAEELDGVGDPELVGNPPEAVLPAHPTSVVAAQSYDSLPQPSADCRPAMLNAAQYPRLLRWMLSAKYCCSPTLPLLPPHASEMSTYLIKSESASATS